MSLVSIVFSPTGGTQKTAGLLWKELGKPERQIDLCNAATSFSEIALQPEDVALIAVPSYGGRVPTLAAQRLSQIRANGARCVLLCVYGNRAYEDTLAEMQALAKGCGFTVIAAVAAVAEHSIARKIAAGRPDQQDEQKLSSFAAQIQQKLEAGGALSAALPGNIPQKSAGGMGMVPKTTSACNGCKLCDQRCPAQAIHYDNPKVIDSKKCISCMRCVSICPQHAKKLNGLLLKGVSLVLGKACAGRKEPELFL